jgi:hypothetical protein
MIPTAVYDVTGRKDVVMDGHTAAGFVGVAKMDVPARPIQDAAGAVAHY